MSTSTHRAMRVREVHPEGSAGVSLILDGGAIADPGQFMMVWLPGIEERPFSVMDDDPLSLTGARVGPFTEAMCRLELGDRLWVRGPYGHGFEPLGERPLLIGGGSGVASLTLLAKKLAAAGQEVTVGLGARTAESLMLAWKIWETPSASLLVATDDGSAGYQGTIIDAVRMYLDDCAFDQLYACGPRPMLRSVLQYTSRRGIPCQFCLEEVMKCGIGVCGACHCGEYLVCADGPVFTGEQLEEMGRL